MLTYYQATADQALAFPAATGQVEADVVIVGGGFAGLGSAISLQERGARGERAEEGAARGEAKIALGGTVRYGIRVRSEIGAVPGHELPRCSPGARGGGPVRGRGAMLAELFRGGTPKHRRPPPAAMAAPGGWLEKAQ